MRNVVLPILLCSPLISVAQAPREREPIIDVHLHALPANAFGPPGSVNGCVPRAFLPLEPADSAYAHLLDCSTSFVSPRTDDALRERTLALLTAHNVIAVTSGPIEFVREWHHAAPARIIPSASIEPLDSVHAWANAGTIGALGELGFQYMGLSPTDSVPEAYFALAERLDLPVAVHVGLGPPAAPYVFAPAYRMRLSNPLLFEDMLARHPRLRLDVMHAGWPMGDEMIALLYAHPQVYVDVGVIDWAIPRKEFYSYLKRLIDAGFGKRIMFGSDEMIWPDAIPFAIDAIQRAPFLSAQEKRDILYNNAARYLRLDTRHGAPVVGRRQPNDR